MEGRRSTDKSYPGDNEGDLPRVLHRRGGFCTSMSAHRILGAEVGSKGLGCSPIKAVRELGSERRETVRSPICRGRRKFEKSCPQYERTGMDASMVDQLSRQWHSWEAKCGRINAEGHL